MRTFRTGETVLADEQPPRFVGNVVSGVLRMQKTLPDGRQHIVGLLVPTDMFGRVFSGPSRFAMEAATDVTLCCFDRRELESLLQRHPELEHGLMISVLDELDAAREWILLLGGHSVRERVATFLLIFARRWPNVTFGQQPPARPHRVQVPISRRDMAQYLGARVETLSRAIHSLVDDGLIEAEDSARFRILDLAGLVAASGNSEFLDHLDSRAG